MLTSAANTAILCGMSKTPAQSLNRGDYPQVFASVPPSPAAVAAALAILAAAWLAAGSVGLWGEVFLRALSYTALAAAVVLLPPSKGRLAVLAAVVAVILMLPLILGNYQTPGYDVLFVAVAAAVLAGSRQGVERSAMAAAAWAAAALGLFRIACDCVPVMWHLADALGQVLGTLAGTVSGRPLRLGSSFAGLDFLPAMITFYAVWLAATPSSRRRRAISGAVAIAVVQITYLLILSQSENLLALLPELPPPPSADPAEYAPPVWSLSAALRGLIPWGLPLAAMIGDLFVAAAMLRWADWGSHETQTDNAEPPAKNSRRFAREYLPIVLLSAAAAFALTFAPCRVDLTGKKIVAYADAGSAAWTLPEHGGEDLMAADGYGMLPSFVASLGGEFVKSESLAENDLTGADVLIIIEPKKPLAEDSLQRVHDFVRGGGSVLLVAGPADAANYDRRAGDEILHPAGMSVRFDRAMPAAPHWCDGVYTLAHPAAVGVDRRRNQFGLNLGCSIGGGDDYRRSAGRPIVVGRWGWCESGGDMTAGNMGVYNGGERLGDVVLAAEKPLGRGTVVVLGDATGLANIGLVYTHPFAARLLGYLAQGGGNPQSFWRQMLATVLLLTLVWFVIKKTRAPKCTRMNRLAAAAATVVVCLAVSMSISSNISGVVPNGRLPHARPIAYIDAAHLGILSDEPWTPRGVGGFAVTLMRNGYMPLMLYKFDEQRLDRAAALAVIGPMREFSKSERQCVGRFVDEGGLLVCAIGAEQSAASYGLLSDFDFSVPHTPVAATDPSLEPAPIGRFPDDFGRAFVAYLNAKDYGRGDYMSYVWLHRPWPVNCKAAENATDILIRGHDSRPVAIAQHRGRGQAVVCGDSHFMLNENHGYVDGRPVDGTAANLDFWRWFFGRVTGAHEWYPPDRTTAKEKEDVKAEKKTSETKPGESTEELPEPVLPFNPLRPDEVK